MKKNLFTIVFLVASITLFAQNDVTKFLGIPVDGTKSEMIEKLKAKGFTSSSVDREILKGEFNGRQVHVLIGTNNNKVYRIMVSDATPESETDIKIRFNKLYRQFMNNSKYLPSLSNEREIPEDEDISYKMLVENKRYQAMFYQSSMPDSAKIANEVRAELLSKYTEEELENLTEDERQKIFLSYMKSYTTDFFTNLKAKSVWFMILEHYGKYCINIYYDNEYNRANGEEL